MAPLALLLVLPPLGTLIHGEADWINRGWWRSPWGELCCGEHDCRALPSDSVRAGADGWRFELDGRRHLVPYGVELPSIDGRYWMCHRLDMSVRCFFVPKPGM